MLPLASKKRYGGMPPLTLGTTVKGVPTCADWDGNVTAIWLLGRAVLDCSTPHPVATPITMSRGSTRSFEDWDWELLSTRAATTWYSTPERMLFILGTEVGGTLVRVLPAPYRILMLKGR